MLTELVQRDAAIGFEQSTILDIDLAPLGRALRFYRSGPDAVRELQAIQAKWGDQWARKRLIAAATALSCVCTTCTAGSEMS